MIDFIAGFLVFLFVAGMLLICAIGAMLIFLLLCVAVRAVVNAIDAGCRRLWDWNL